jgi:hypothetical protein
MLAGHCALQLRGVFAGIRSKSSPRVTLAVQNEERWRCILRPSPHYSFVTNSAAIASPIRTEIVPRHVSLCHARRIRLPAALDTHGSSHSLAEEALIAVLQRLK